MTIEYAAHDEHEVDLGGMIADHRFRGGRQVRVMTREELLDLRDEIDEYAAGLGWE